MDNVTVPTELTEEAVKKIMDGLLIAAQKDCMSSVPCKECGEEDICDRISNNLSLVYPLIVEHFQAHPITTDAEKAATYWRAIALDIKPDWVPSKVNLPKTVDDIGLIMGPGVVECDSDRMGRVYVPIENTSVLLTRRQFEPIAWRKNEADNEG